MKSRSMSQPNAAKSGMTIGRVCGSVGIMRLNLYAPVESTS